MLREWTRFLASFFVVLVSYSPTQGQNQDEHVLIGFYNLENLFDIYDDSLKRDEEFTPNGIRNWSTSKFYHKVNNLGSAILTIGDWSAVDILGVCEVENRHCLNVLTQESPLAKYQYGISHFESPDKRGIDVALLYNKNKIKVVQSRKIAIQFPNEEEKKTRDILHTTIATGRDTIHVFVNHWPSKYGGAQATIKYRNHVSKTLVTELQALREKGDSLFVIMGDLNAEPEEWCVKNLGENGLKSAFEPPKDWGSHKYRSTWSTIDRIFISEQLQKHWKVEKAGIVNKPFLLEKDEKFLGEKPRRSFIGMKYNRGYSDHLPVYLELKKQ